MRSEEWMREREFETVREWVVRHVPDLRHRSRAHGEVMSSPCASSQAHGEHGISIFHVNETCILLNFSMSFLKFVLKLKTRP